MLLTNEKNQLQGFKVLEVKFSEESSSKHEMFMKEHSVRNQEQDKPVGRTLFLINVPPWATEYSLLRSFSTVAPVESVKFSTDNVGFKSCFIVFKNSPDLYKALKLKYLPPLSTKEIPILTGMEKWIKEYNDNILTQPQRQEEALEIIKKYDQDEQKRKLKEKSGETDDEGWTVVGKAGRNPGISRKESVTNKINEKISKKEKVLKNFYRHQIRQGKRDQLANLRKKAEEDKKKILAMKQRRAFKPF